MGGDERREIGHRIRELRERQGWDRDELARRLGVHSGSIARWETGGAVPHAYTLGRIAEMGGATAEWIRTGRGAPDAVEDAGQAERDEEEPFVSADAMARFLEAIGPPGEAALRKLDALEGLRRMLTAGGVLPDWWYELREAVEEGRL